MASPAFAKVIQSAPAYSQAAPPDLPPTALSSDVAPQMPTAQPNVELAPLANEIGRDRGQLQKIQWAQENPYGTANNHPGKLGKLAHAFSMIGNIAGDIFAPSTMALIPGTQLNRQRSEGFLANRLNQEQEQQQQEMTQGAQEHESEERTKEAPAKAASEEGLQGAQVTNLESEARDRDAATAMGPTLAAGYSHAVNEAVKAGRDPAQDPIVQHLADSITAIQKQTVPKGMEKVDLVGPGGKPIAANYDPLKGTYTDATGKLIENPQPYEKPNQAGMVTVVNPEGVVQRLAPGQHMEAGSMSPTQVGAGAAADVKQGKTEKLAEENAQKDYQLMTTLATHPSPTNDLAMVMHYIGATKPDSLGKLRLNQNEIGLVMGTRSSFGDLEALAQKVQNGEMLTPHQRQDMLATMRILSQAPEGGNEPMVQHSPSTGQYRYSTDGGKTWQAGQPQKQ